MNRPFLYVATGSLLALGLLSATDAHATFATFPASMCVLQSGTNSVQGSSGAVCNESTGKDSYVCPCPDSTGAQAFSATNVKMFVHANGGCNGNLTEGSVETCRTAASGTGGACGNAVSIAGNGASSVSITPGTEWAGSASDGYYLYASTLLTCSGSYNCLWSYDFTY